MAGSNPRLGSNPRFGSNLRFGSNPRHNELSPNVVIGKVGLLHPFVLFINQRVETGAVVGSNPKLGSNPRLVSKQA